VSELASPRSEPAIGCADAPPDATILWSQVDSNKVLEQVFDDRTCQVERDLRSPSVRSFSACHASTPAPLHQRTSPMIGRSLSASGHLLASASGHMTETAPSLELMTGRAGPSEACVWSPPVTCFRLRFFAEFIYFNFKHFSFVNIPTPPCVCVLAFHKYF
jgi:hypothetical protein